MTAAAVRLLTHPTRSGPRRFLKAAFDFTPIADVTLIG